MLNVVENRNKHLLLRHTKGRIIRIFVGTVMNNTIHIQIQTVEFWYSILRNQLRDRGIPLAHPSEELWDTHDANTIRRMRGMFECCR